MLRKPSRGAATPELVSLIGRRFVSVSEVGEDQAFSEALPREQFQELFRLIRGYRVSQALYVVARLGIADLLADGAQDSDELARATGTHPGALYRLLRFLAAAGLFREAAPHALP